MRPWSWNVLLFLSVIFSDEVNGQSLPSIPFEEQYTYKIRYGWITIGKAHLDHELGEDRIRIGVLAYTTGILNWIARLKDSIHTEMYRSTLKPVRTFMDRREGKYSRKETDFFDFDRDTARIFIYKKTKEDSRAIEQRFVALKDSTFDMLSAYAHLRAYDWGNADPGDSVMINMFYEGKYYDFGVEYIRKTMLETSLGQFSCHEAYILFPISRTFPEKHMIKVWVTADERKLPVLVEAKMKFGKAVCELISIE